jgi:DNA-binding CsgD family transcriptional regulator
MALQLGKTARWPYGLLVLIVAQIVCAIIFFGDVVGDFQEKAPSSAEKWGLLFQTAAACILFLTVVVEVGLIRSMLRRQSKLEESISIAAAAMHEAIDAHFELWALTPAEKEIATYLIKGSSISEMAAFRGSAEGTIKAHLNAIYKKSGVSGRGELMSLILDSVLNFETQ